MQTPVIAMIIAAQNRDWDVLDRLIEDCDQQETLAASLGILVGLFASLEDEGRDTEKFLQDLALDIQLEADLEK